MRSISYTPQTNNTRAHTAMVRERKQGLLMIVVIAKVWKKEAPITKCTPEMLAMNNERLDGLIAGGKFGTCKGPPRPRPRTFLVESGRRIGEEVVLVPDSNLGIFRWPNL